MSYRIESFHSRTAHLMIIFSKDETKTKTFFFYKIPLTASFLERQCNANWVISKQMAVLKNGDKKGQKKKKEKKI